jgi:hypothetical protein
MIQKIKVALLSLASLFMFSAPFAVGAVASAQTGDTGNATIQGSTCYGANQLQINATNQSGTCNDASSTTKVNDLIRQVINVISVIVGVVAVIMIIIGGFKYITSGGSPDKVAGAKNTILYGLIGLIIVALAQVVVRFVLNKVAGTA